MARFLKNIHEINPHCLIRVLVYNLENAGTLSTHRAPIKDSEQTVRKCRFVSVDDGRTC